jgi:hypothetical protein
MIDRENHKEIIKILTQQEFKNSISPSINKVIDMVANEAIKSTKISSEEMGIKFDENAYKKFIHYY